MSRITRCRMRKRSAILSIVLLIVLVAAGAFFLYHFGPSILSSPNGENTVNEDAMKKREAFRTRLTEARDDDARWVIIHEVFSEDLAESGYGDVESRIKAGLKVIYPGSEDILRIWPGITKRLQWTINDLKEIGASLDSEDRPFLWASQVTQGDISRILLEQLTGKKFKSTAEWNAWFAAKGKELVWDKNACMFTLGGATSKSGTGSS